jgi:hypothetical protein
MTTQPVMLQPRAARAAFWEQFQREVEIRVRECNTLADEPLWVVSGAGGPLRRLTVQSAARSGDRIDCSFDAQRGILVCSPGPDVRARRLQFRLSNGRLSLDGREYRIEEALRLVLDELVCVDDK